MTCAIPVANTVADDAAAVSVLLWLVMSQLLLLLLLLALLLLSLMMSRLLSLHLKLMHTADAMAAVASYVADGVDCTVTASAEQPQLQDPLLQELHRVELHPIHLLEVLECNGCDY